VWEKVRGVFPVTANGKNATNFFPYLIQYINIQYKLLLLIIGAEKNRTVQQVRI